MSITMNIRPAALALVLVLALVQTGATASDDSLRALNSQEGPIPNFGIVLSKDGTNDLIDALIPEVEGFINGVTLPTCCYADALGTNFDFKNLTVHDAKLDLAVSNSAETLKIAGSIYLPLLGEYLLCQKKLLKDECKPWGTCTGSFYMNISAAMEIDVKLSVIFASKINVKTKLAKLKVLSIEENLCGWFSNLVNSTLLVDVVNAELNKILKPDIEKIGTELSALLNSPIATQNANVSLSYSPETAITNESTLIVASASVVAPTGKVPPVAPKSFPSAADLNDNNIHLVLGDSVLTEALYAFAEQGLLAINETWTYPNGTCTLNVSIEASPLPLVSFNKTDQVIELTFTVGIVPCSQNNNYGMIAKFQTLLDIAIDVTKSVKDDEAYFNISLKCNDVGIIKIISCKPERPGPCVALDWLRLQLDIRGKDLFNLLLEKIPIVIPGGKLVSNLALDFGASYLDVLVDVSASSLQQAIYRRFSAPAQASESACPDIVIAKPSKCY